MKGGRLNRGPDVGGRGAPPRPAVPSVGVIGNIQVGLHFCLVHRNQVGSGRPWAGFSVFPQAHGAAWFFGLGSVLTSRVLSSRASDLPVPVWREAERPPGHGGSVCGVPGFAHVSRGSHSTQTSRQEERQVPGLPRRTRAVRGTLPSGTGRAPASFLWVPRGLDRRPREHQHLSPWKPQAAEPLRADGMGLTPDPLGQVPPSQG